MRAGLGVQPIVPVFLHCRKLLMNTTNFRQKIRVTSSPLVHLRHFLTVNTASEDRLFFSSRPTLQINLYSVRVNEALPISQQ
jgi:hypothetical protein